MVTEEVLRIGELAEAPAAGKDGLGADVLLLSSDMISEATRVAS